MKIIMLMLASLLSTPLFSAQLSRITAFNKQNNEFEIQTSDGALTKIIFYRSDIFRIWVKNKKPSHKKNCEGNFSKKYPGYLCSDILAAFPFNFLR